VSGKPQRVLRSSEALRKIMTLQGHDTVTLAAATGLSKQLIGYLRSGARTSCSSRTAELVSKALGFPEGTLFSEAVSDETEERTSR